MCGVSPGVKGTIIDRREERKSDVDMEKKTQAVNCAWLREGRSLVPARQDLLLFQYTCTDVYTCT